jgi:hypothetical protein
VRAALTGVLPGGPQQDDDLIMSDLTRAPRPSEDRQPNDRPSSSKLSINEGNKSSPEPTVTPVFDGSRPHPGDLPGPGSNADLPEGLIRELVESSRSQQGTGPTEGIRSHQGTGPPEAASSDAASTARQAQEIVHNELDISQELSQLENGSVRSTIKVRTERALSEFDVVIGLGNNASPSQVLVTVLLYADSENQVLASQDDASDADKDILQAIQGRFAKARIPFWTALASLGKVKEWSVSLEISAGFFAVKGTGGISVTFGK